jgi:hypothetical protein
MAPSAHDPVFGAKPTQRFSDLRRRIAAEAG